MVFKKIAYYIGISFDILFYGTLYNYSLDVYYDLSINSFIEHMNNPLLVMHPWDMESVMKYHCN
jgi:hypothetical protein